MSGYGELVSRFVVEDGVRYAELLSAPEKAVIGHAMLSEIAAGKTLPAARFDSDGVLHLGTPGRGVGVARYRVGGFVIAENGHELTRVDEPAPDEPVITCRNCSKPIEPNEDVRLTTERLWTHTRCLSW